ncbi:MAG: 30S ribosomal protein S6e [Candidatus Thermoplasmatota archaeon]|nr:30S ribosomal protein S6e [Candidatus Thermoplasmatota archaeon]
MVEFKVNVGDPASGRTFPVEVSGQHANVLVRKRIGEEVDGMFLGLPGYKVQITGGTDKDGFPMRPELPLAGRKKILVSKSIGFRPKDRGVRKKLAFRGNEVSPEITQINCRITDRGPKPVEQLLGLDGSEDEEEAVEEASDEAGEENAE